jgi:protein required for attachment to host cells
MASGPRIGTGHVVRPIVDQDQSGARGPMQDCLPRKEPAMSTTWILVSDRARARLFSLVPGAGDLQELSDFVNPLGDVRTFEGERPPSTHDRIGHASHGIEPHTTPEEKSARAFASQLAGAVEHGRVEHRFQDLVLIAPAHFLGALNTALGPQERRCVVSEVCKDLVDASPARIHQELPRSIQRGQGIVTDRQH